MNKKEELNILVVDDEKPIQKIMKKFLEFYKYNVDTVGNVEEALKLLALNSYHIMFLDLNMPGLSGEEFIKKYHKDFPNLYIIIMSVYYDKPLYVQEYIERMAYAVLKKPFEFDDVIELIKKIEGEIDGN